MNQLFAGLPMLMAAPAGGAEGNTTGSTLSMVIMLGAVFLVMYFLMIRPQKKQQQQMKNMLAALKKGDKVVTAGGIRGVVQSVKEDVVVLKVDDNTKIEFSKSAIAAVTEAAEKSGD